jgi:UDP-2,3-diacylglucosamine hydrolase
MPSPSTQSTLSLPEEDVWFVSDVHLGGSSPEAEEEKRARLLALLARVKAENASLFVLGDLFDFWFEYRTVIPRTAFGILAALDDLARATGRVYYLGGNHDSWLCDFLEKETSIQVLPDGTVAEVQGRRAWLAHGDGLGPGDTGYKILKKLIRNPLAIKAFRWIHPDIGIPLALSSSHVSRESTADHAVDVDALYRNVARPVLGAGADAVLLGHHHVAEHRKEPEGEFLILGDWFRTYSCARLREGKFSLLHWPLD